MNRTWQSCRALSDEPDDSRAGGRGKTKKKLTAACTHSAPSNVFKFGGRQIKRGGIKSRFYGKTIGSEWVRAGVFV